jgi:hypothetical protein
MHACIHPKHEYQSCPHIPHKINLHDTETPNLANQSIRTIPSPPTPLLAFQSTYIFPSPPFLSLSTALSALSPSTSTHQPSPPLPPSPPTAASLNSLSANSNPSLSKLPGCSQTAGMPSLFASCKTFMVTLGGVMIDTDVVVGEGSAESDGRVA